ncbi:CAP domain-containing protein [Virgibacillus flavescens]|uniref:CAP domain-containing protein n=1 Tax=Virgibacillus flavescens TaxID=1611422 RepID=UPI003D32601A
MKLNRLLISIIPLFLFVLVACNNNDVENNPNDDTSKSTSSIFTGTSNDEFFKGKQKHYPDNVGFNMEDINENRERSPLWERQNKMDRPPSNQNSNRTRQQQTNEADDSQPLTPNKLNEFETKVIELTNTERKNAGLSGLKEDASLSRVAELKSRDMVNNNYFSHTSPTYGSPFDMMSEFGVSYNAAGENIAHGQQTPEQVVNAWMGSEGHRANILNSDFTHIGVGYIKNGDYWTQMFIRK